MRPAVLNRHHLKGDWPEGAIYVGRGTPLGNPFQVDDAVSRDEAVDRFDEYLKERIGDCDPAIMTALMGAARASALVCSCVPARCHAEIVREHAIRLGAVGIAPFAPSFAYAGIGSRETPPDVLKRMRGVASRLAARGFQLRSGGADGADTAFEEGAAGAWQSGKESRIFLPWPHFNERSSLFDRPTDVAHAVAGAVHPTWSRLSDTTKALHARNSHQILGEDLRQPVDFVVCWTRDGCEAEDERTSETGGTGQAIALADRWGIPVFNLARPDALDRIKERLDKIDAFWDTSGEPEIPPELREGIDAIKRAFPGAKVASVYRVPSSG